MQYPVKNINKIPSDSGVYQFIDKNSQVLYVGKAKDLKKRVSSYFGDKKLDNKTDILVRQVKYVKTIPVETELDAFLLEANLIKNLEPKYNFALKDDKSYIYITITNEEFPRVLISRRTKDKNVTSYGPFPSKGIVKVIVAYLRRIFPFCTQSPHIKRSCFYAHLGLCNPCPAEIKKLKGAKRRSAKALYLKNIRNIRFILCGKSTKLLKKLKKEMIEKSASLEFEKAASLRDKVNKLNCLYKLRDLSSRYMENSNFLKERVNRERKDLELLLKKHFYNINKLNRIECYDVSNISGTMATGAMITFTDGKPAKKYYRRFKIKRKDHKDDFSQLKEILTRRLKHTDWPLPDLLVVDGGKPQLKAFGQVLKQLDFSLPYIGLAKQEEQIVIPEGEKYLRVKLRRCSYALQLIQRVRDEAHRFAHKYHQLLRLKHLLPKH